MIFNFKKKLPQYRISLLIKKNGKRKHIFSILAGYEYIFNLLEFTRNLVNTSDETKLIIFLVQTLKQKKKQKHIKKKKTIVSNDQTPKT